MWGQNPFSVYAHAEQVFIDGAKVYDRFDEKYQAKSDFMLGQATLPKYNAATQGE